MFATTHLSPRASRHLVLVTRKPRKSSSINQAHARTARRVAGLSLWFAPLGVSFALPANAQQDNKAQASAHFTRGVDLASEGAYAEALIEFSRAYELSPHYSVLYNIGQAYVGLGKPVQAVDALKRYLGEGGAQLTLERRRQVEAEIVKQFERTAALTVEVNAPGASVSVDGEVVGRAPLSEPIRVSIGVHRIVARLDSGVTSERTLTVAGEEQHTVKLELSVELAVPAPVAARGWLEVACSTNGLAVSVDGSVRGVTPLLPLELGAGVHRVGFSGASSERTLSLANGQTVRVECQAPVTTGSGRGARSTWGYVLGAAGIGLGGAAVAHFAWNLGRYHDWETARAEYEVRPTSDKRKSANELGASVERASVVTIALGVGAGLSLGTGTLLLITDGGGSGKSASSGTWLGWRGRF